MAFPKIKLGSQVQKKARFDLSKDVNTTADFGFVYPLGCTELVPNSSISIKGNHLCRLAPMSLPTFGRVSMHVYNCFVKVPDIYEPFENLMAAKTYTNGGISYVPTRVPNFDMKFLMWFLLLDKGDNVSSFQNSYKCCASIYAKQRDGSGYKLVSADSSASVTIVQNALKTFFGVDQAPLQLHFDAFAPIEADTHGYSQSHYVPMENCDYSLTLLDGDYVVCWRLSDRGRLFRSLMLGLGYQLTFDDVDSISALPLFAYYKAYYDLFSPQRTSTWTDTNFYKLMKYIETKNFVDIRIGDPSERGSLAQLTCAFLYDVLECYYTFNQDFVSAHIDSPAIAPAESLSMNSYDSLEPGESFIGANLEPSLTNVSSGSANNLRLIQKLLNFRNIETNIGGRIKEYFKTIFGTEVLHNDESSFVNSYVINMNISDVMNQAQTETNGQTNYLGDYAGRGIGHGSNGTKYDAKQFGFFITLFSIVPVSDYFQGIDPYLSHIDRFTFFNPSFDALGYELNTKTKVACLSEHASGWSAEQGFGFVPRYTSGYKTSQSICAGDISLPSLRNQYLGYSLDRFITPNGYSRTAITECKTDGVYNSGDATIIETVVPIASETYRYLNRYKWLGNYNRMFYNNSQNDYKPLDASQAFSFHEDNFFLNNILDIEVFAPMKPISESFTTEGESERTVNVVKA